MSTTTFTEPTTHLTYGPLEAAKALGISRSSIFELMKSGAIPAFKLGRRTLLRANDLTAFLEKLPAKAIN
jgi:excisionase family DNA binding protein